MALSLAALADLAEEEGRSTVDLLSPRVRFRSVGHSDLDACLDWFAELIMTVDIDDADDVVVGSLDFTVIRLGTEDPIALCLDQFDGDHEMLAGLFDGNQLAEQVEEQYETPTVVTEAVLIPNIAFVTEPLRGHDLGAWLVSETIHRMLPTGIVLMWPYPVLTPGSDPDADPDADPVHIAALDSAIGRLSGHFGRCGLTPVESAPWALGMSTTFEALAVARSRLGAVRRTTVSLSLDVAVARSASGRLPATGTGRVTKVHAISSARHRGEHRCVPSSIWSCSRAPLRSRSVPSFPSPGALCRATSR